MHDESLYFEDIAVLEKRLERTKSSKLRNSLFLLYVYGSNDTLDWNEICIHHVKIINHNSQSLEIERYNFLESASLFNHSRIQGGSLRARRGVRKKYSRVNITFAEPRRFLGIYTGCLFSSKYSEISFKGI